MKHGVGGGGPFMIASTIRWEDGDRKTPKSRFVTALCEKPSSDPFPRSVRVGPGRLHKVEQGWGSRVGSKVGGFC